MVSEHPKVFVSHASEDKDRFVLDFASKLRERGIDAWVDRWEMLPGDSLVRKIFEEGIRNAQAVIVVLSTSSVQKRWVREELDAAVVKRINGESKLIPVVIDDCEVPEALRSTVWERIYDLNNYEQSLGRIVAAIYGHVEKPPLGPLPQYAQLKVDKLPGLTHIDTLVFKTICETSLKTGWPSVEVSKLEMPLKQLGISETNLSESLDILDEKYLIKGTRVMTGKISFLVITSHGFEQYARSFISGFDALLPQILLAIINHNLKSSTDIASLLDKPRILINYALDILDQRSLVKIQHVASGAILIFAVTAQGKRLAQGL